MQTVHERHWRRMLPVVSKSGQKALFSKKAKKERGRCTTWETIKKELSTDLHELQVLYAQSDEELIRILFLLRLLSLLWFPYNLLRIGFLGLCIFYPEKPSWETFDDI